MSQYRNDYREFEKEAIWTLPRIIFLILLAVVLLAVVGFVGNGISLESYKFWGKKVENAKYQVFQQSQPYMDGEKAYIAKLCREARTAQDATLRASLYSEITDESSRVDNAALPNDLNSCINQAKDAQQ